MSKRSLSEMTRSELEALVARMAQTVHSGEHDMCYEDSRSPAGEDDYRCEFCKLVSSLELS